MDKKQYVLRMLDALQNTWPLAIWLKHLVEANPLNNVLLDLLIKTFQETLKTIDDQAQKAKIQQASHFLEELKNQEIKSIEKDQEDIANLESMLAAI